MSSSLRTWGSRGLALVFAAASVVSFSGASGRIQQFESDVAGSIARWLSGGQVRPIPLIGSMLILRRDGALIADVTYWCSLSTVLGVLFAAAAVMAAVRRVRVLRLAVGVTGALATVAIVNQIRLVLTVMSGYEWGRARMETVHDYVGTPLSMGAFGIAILLLVGWTMSRSRAARAAAFRPTTSGGDS